jgi:hypothetical protein
VREGGMGGVRRGIQYSPHGATCAIHIDHRHLIRNLAHTTPGITKLPRKPREWLGYPNRWNGEVLRCA